MVYAGNKQVYARRFSFHSLFIEIYSGWLNFLIKCCKIIHVIIAAAWL
jgi:hypothetical protein